MKRICLVVVGLYCKLLGGFSQISDSVSYAGRKLRTEEINFVSSYYAQDGSNSAVTGGTGTEKLADISNNFEIKLYRYNGHHHKVDWDMNLGIDYYTSASSDKIDPATISSASSRDLRIYPSVSRTVTNEQKGKAFTINLSYSHESDYQSYGFGAAVSKKSKNNNREFLARAQCYLDRVRLILPVELRTPATGGLYGADNQYDYPWSARNTFATSFSCSQIIDQRLQLMLLLDIAYQQGFLSLPFHRVYFNDNQLRTELLPSSRFKIPAGIRANYFAGDKIIIRSFYRFYADDWGIIANTADIETVFKLNPFFSISPFYRYYGQTACTYFAAYQQHSMADTYFSSNYDLSKFNSHFFGAGFRIVPAKGLLGKKNWSMIELRYGHYKRSNGLNADIVSVHLKFK